MARTGRGPGTSWSTARTCLKEWVPNDHIRLEKKSALFRCRRHRRENRLFLSDPGLLGSAEAISKRRIRCRHGLSATAADQLAATLSPARVAAVALHSVVNMCNSTCGANHSTIVRVRLAFPLRSTARSCVTKVTRAGETAAYSFVPPGMPHISAARTYLPRRTHAASGSRAPRLCSVQAGHGPDNPVTFDFNTSNTTESRLAAVAFAGHVERYRRQGAHRHPLTARSTTTCCESGTSTWPGPAGSRTIATRKIISRFFRARRPISIMAATRIPRSMPSSTNPTTNAIFPLARLC